MSKIQDPQPSHPGAFVREQVIPSGMSVKEAADRLAIGRPALSNFLNGNSALSPEMAAKLEKAFGADRNRLLELQASYERSQHRPEEAVSEVRAFVPSFLTIKAKQVEGWASDIDARSRLPVLLRRLVHSTGADLRRVEFPGYDNSQRTGVDGYVESGAANPWIPQGKSYWEFGTNQDPARKADGDYSARTRSIDPTERAASSFVFVTPRNWPGKTDWEKRKNERGEWGTVRAYDASDMEQWLEQSVPAQIWLAEQLSLPARGFETLEHAWERWANASSPVLVPEVFAAHSAAHRGTLKSWLANPSGATLVISADSKDEALAFLACQLETEELRGLKDRAAIFTSAEELRKIIDSSVPFIPIVCDRQVERELASARRPLRAIVFRPRNSVVSEVDITLDRLKYMDFRQAIEAMGIEGDEVDRLDRESGRSLSILRRRLSKIPAIREPAWASDNQVAKSLIPIALLGAWHSDTVGDRAVMEKVASVSYEQVESDLTNLLTFEDSPVWSIGQYRGAVSKLDAFFAVSMMVTKDVLDRFFDVASQVLSEADPALDLPEEQRWAAELYGKKRAYSSVLRDGVCETLVLLSVFGNDLFRERVGLDLEYKVSSLVRKLMLPLSMNSLLSSDDDLPKYAEAAPGEFVDIIENDLRSTEPVVLGLLKPVNMSPMFGSPFRTGLLWALECLAWKPRNLPRVARILAQLSRTRIDDNWENKPISSLLAIMRGWMPQTAASLEERVKVLEMLFREFPGVAWQIAVDQIKTGFRTGSSNYRPRWRNDASGAGGVASREEIWEFYSFSLALLIGWSSHTENTLGDLIVYLDGMPEEEQDKVWRLVESWSDGAKDSAREALRDKIRMYHLSGRSRRRDVDEKVTDRAREIYEHLQPEDVVARHCWLFSKEWLELPVDRGAEVILDHVERSREIYRRRRLAMKEVWSQEGFLGVRELLSVGEAPGAVGEHAIGCLEGYDERASLIKDLLALEGDIRDKATRCVQSCLYSIEEDERGSVLRAAAKGLPLDEIVRLFAYAPVKDSTWKVLEEYEEDVLKGYWKTVSPFWARERTSVESNELVDRLLGVRRPRAAFSAVRMEFEDIETARLKRMMRDLATITDESGGRYVVEESDIVLALKSLEGRPGVIRSDLAELEFLFIEILDDSRLGIPNLEKEISESPGLFAQAVAYVYKQSGEGEDPPGWEQLNSAQRAAMQRSSLQLLNQLNRIPGTAEDGGVGLAALKDWVVEVRKLCSHYGRVEMGDRSIGELLAKGPIGGDSIWPCEAVRLVLEEVATSTMGEGFRVGILKSRGVHSRVVDEGGAPERELATKYRDWADALHFDCPYVGAQLEEVAAHYERQAGWHDSEAKLSGRLG